MGDFLQGWDVNQDGTSTSLDLSNTHNIRLPADTGAPQMSTNISIGVNLPADKDPVKPNQPAQDPWAGTAWPQGVPVNESQGIFRGQRGGANPDPKAANFIQYYTDFDPKDASTYQASTSQTIHDSLGRAHTLTYYMIKTGPDAKDSNNTNWTVIPYVDGHPVDVKGKGLGPGISYKDNPVCLTVNGKSTIAGSNLFGFQVKFGPNGEVLEQYPAKVELVNPADAAAANQKVPGSLRHALFGNPNAPANSPDATGVLAQLNQTQNKPKDPTFTFKGQEGNDGSLHTALGQGIEPTQMLNIQFAASQYGSTQNKPKDPTFTFKGQEGNDGSLHTALGQGIEPTQMLNIQFAASQYGSSNFSVSQAPTNDGYATGILIGMSVDENGIIQCEYSNGQVKNIAKVAMADFANTQGLTKIGDTQWKQSNASGEAIAKEANSGSCGSIKGSNLELSNVDLTNELVELITAQRNYQANAQSLQTQNTVMDSILNIR